MSLFDKRYIPQEMKDEVVRNALTVIAKNSQNLGYYMTHATEILDIFYPTEEQVKVLRDAQFLSEYGGTFGFGDVLTCLREGKQLAREGWNGNGMYIQLQRPDAMSKMGAQYIFIKGTDDKRTPWTPSQADMFANDWFLLESDSDE